MSANRLAFQCTLILALSLVRAGFAQAPLGSGFTYQGQLKQDGFVLNGLVDIAFSLHPAAVTPDQIGSDVRIDAVEVVGGAFNVEVDFGADAFAGAARFLEVRVRTPHDPSDAHPFVTLTPRQVISPTPYATHASNAASAHVADLAIAAQTADVALVAQRPFREVGTDAVFEGGNVGIGTATPNSKLDVAGDGRFEGSILFDTISMIEVAHVNNTGIVIDPLANTVSLEADNSAVLTADASGRVGVGITTPATDLHVRGNSGLRVDDKFGTSVLSAKGNGFVGVGTSTPTAKLNVKSDADLIDGPVTQSDDVVVESADAVLGLYSDEAGATGSAISLKEIHPQGPLTDHWAMYRNTNQVGAALRFTYGPNVDYKLNPERFVLTPGSGDDAVILPADSVGRDEIADEPGVASNLDGQLVVVDSEQTLIDASIDVPTDGFVLAYASVVGNADTLGIDTSWMLWIEDNDTGHRGVTYVDSVEASVFSTVSFHEVFSVTAGDHSFSVKATPLIFSLPTVAFGDRRLTLMFIPTPYGAVDVAQAP